jgi:transposase
VAAKGPAGIGPLVERLAGADIPTLARELFTGLAEERAGLCTRIAALDRRLRDWRAKNEVARRLTAIPGVGRLIASRLVMKAPDPHRFKSGRDVAAWLGLTPRDPSTAGKARPGRITRAGDPMLRSLLVVGATAVIWQTRRGAAKNPSGWVLALLERKPAKLAAVALANKMARIAWKLMASGERYACPDVAPAPAAG